MIKKFEEEIKETTKITDFNRYMSQEERDYYGEEFDKNR